jgi:hypothetical protein
MKYKKHIAIFSILLLITGSSIVVMAFLITHKFNDIDENSLLKYIVDKEIRNLPIIREGSNISYKSHPVDGTSRGFDSVTLGVKNKDEAHKQIVDYFTSLGYTQEGDFDFQKNGVEITIDQTGNTVKIAKYSWN